MKDITTSKDTSTTNSITVEVQKPSKFRSYAADTPLVEEKKRFTIKWWMIVLVFLILLISITGSLIWWYVAEFEKAAGTSIETLWPSINAGLRSSIFEDNKPINFLLLGLDEVRNQREGSLLTDTIMLVSVQQSGKITLLSLPRDLWIDSLKTKINALYYYGEESDETTGVDLTADVVEEITGQNIDYTIIITLETLEALVDAVGGVTIDVENGFEDKFFPREGVDITATDPAILYETVKFDRGVQHFNGKNAMKYIRSRQSEDENEGNDGARNKRQQQLFSALFAQLKTPTTFTNPTILGSVYRVWRYGLKSTLNDDGLISIAKDLRNSRITLNNASIPIQEKESQGLITHPPLQKYDLWVFEPVDPTWKQLKEWVNMQLDQVN